MRKYGAVNELIGSVSADRITDLLIDCFSETMGRPLEEGSLTREELKAAEEEAQELGSTEILALHQNGSTAVPMQSLKISARASIRWETARLDGLEIQGNFWLAEGLIRKAILVSIPDRDWYSTEQKLRGTAIQDWKQQLELSD